MCDVIHIPTVLMPFTGPRHHCMLDYLCLYLICAVHLCTHAAAEGRVCHGPARPELGHKDTG